MKHSTIFGIALPIVILSATIAPTAARDFASAWETVATLTDEQKYTTADSAVVDILRQAQAAGNDEHWARALIQRVRLRIALGAPETAVRDLRAAAWPRDPRWKGIVDLFYAEALARYRSRYSHEIRSREFVATADSLDLKAWTIEQFSREIDGAYWRVWSARESWGDAPPAAWSLFIDPNTYPDRIRGTLRDVVTYLWVEQLANTRRWRPGQQDAFAGLDLERLLTGSPPADLGSEMEDPDVHPLRKISFVLHDLQRWHRERGRREAALEADLANVGRLAKAWPHERGKVRVRQYLETRLADFDAAYAWWAKGQWQLARLLQREREPESLLRAHLAAERGVRRHRYSLGGKMCAAVIAEIEREQFELNAMLHDAAEQRSIQIRYQNLERLHFQAWRFDIAERVGNGEDPKLSRAEIEDLVVATEPDLRWQMDLPRTEDFRRHDAYTGLPACEPGAYLVVGSVRRDFDEHANILFGVVVIVSDLTLTTQMMDDQLEIIARNSRTGSPVDDVAVTVYDLGRRRHAGPPRLTLLKTGAAGRAVFPLQDGDRVGLLARKGADLAWLDRTQHYRHRAAFPVTDSFIYTDRAIYRPGQTVHWKVIAYHGNAERAEFATLANEETTISLVDANGREVASEDLTTNDFGSASGSFAIPATALLGHWRLRDSSGGTASIKVEQYKRPTFEVQLLDPEEPLQLNRTATLNGQVNYFFGAPVTSGQVKWRVTRSARRRDPHWRGTTGRPEVVAAGQTELDPEGGFALDFSAATDPRLEPDDPLIYRYRVAADVTDDGGETRTVERSYNVGLVALQAQITAEQGFLASDGRVEFTISRQDLNNVPQAGVGNWVLHRLRQPDTTRLPAATPRPENRNDLLLMLTPGDEQYPRWQAPESRSRVLARWETGLRVASGPLQHAADGLASFTVGDLPSGAYRIIYTTRDSAGEICETRHEFVAAGRTQTDLNLPLVLAVEEFSVAVGDTARVLVHSGFADQEILVRVFSGGERIRSEFRRAERESDILEIPVTPAARNGLQIQVSAVRDHLHFQRTQSILVPWDEKKLDIAFTTFRDRLTPGDETSFTVQVTSHDGTPLARATTELLSYMYDRSLETFARHHAPLPWRVHAQHRGVASMQTSLGHGRGVLRHHDRRRPARNYDALTPDRLLLYLDQVRMRPGELYVRGGRSGDVVMGVDANLAQRLKSSGIPIAEAMDVEGAEYMVEVKSGVTEHMVGSETFQKYAIDSIEDAVAKQAGVIMRAGDLEGVGGRAVAVALRENFAETAFFLPHVRLDAEGRATISFKVPDSVTDWNLWVHAVTRDLRSGSAVRQAASVKDLMVRPYLPRFLREGDSARLKVVVNNSGTAALEGRLELKILDPETGADLGARFGLDDGVADFAVAAGSGTDLSFDLQAPAQVGAVLVKAVARAGNVSDGEQRLLPLLPGRMHLVQSRFVTLDDRSRRELHFPMLAADDDATRIHDQLVVTIDAQLFGSVLSALPYLLDYPYECTEQTLNRYLSTSILAGVFANHPAVRAMAKEMSARPTPTEAWTTSDPNRRLLLEESPWLRTSRGGPPRAPVINVLDPAVASRQRETALDKLAELQNRDGGFSWFPGGRSSPHMTLYILQGLARGAEFGVPAPKAIARSAWRFLHSHFRPQLQEQRKRKVLSLAQVTLLNYLMSCYAEDDWSASGFTNDDRELMLEFSFANWRAHSQLMKGYLALTLARAGRDDDARLVFASVMDAAKQDPDLGTYWAPEDRAWLWYNDRIESHAFTLRVLTELDPDDSRRKGLVQWLLLNKKLGHWKSTRATAEVIYALVHFMQQDGTLAVREAITVQAGAERREFVFDPEHYSGRKNQLVVPGAAIDPETMATVVVAKETPGLAFASATWHFSTEQMPARSDGDLFAVTRRYYRRTHDGEQWTLEPLAAGDAVAVGDQVEVQLAVTARQAAEYVHLRDPRGAGFEPESHTSGYRWQTGLGYYEEVRDSGANFFFARLPTGQYTLKYRLRANMAGAFKVGPATLQSLYAPEFAAYSRGHVVRVAP